MQKMMHKTILARLVQAALVPTVAIGVSVAAQAQGNTAGTGSAPAATATQGQPSQNATYRGLRASKVIGESVRNSQGKDIGEIEDLIVDMNSGQVRYAMLSFDPGILSGEKLFAVPTNQLRMAADRDDIVYDVSKEKLEQATVDRSEWNNMKPEQRIARVDKAWGLARPGEGARAQRVSDLIGGDVNSRSGQEVGEIEDLVINMAQQKVHYAVMQFDPGWGSPERRYVLPLRSFDLGRDGDELVLNVDKSKVQGMKSYDRDLYSDLNDRDRVAEIDHYFVNVLPTVVATGGSPSGTSGSDASAGRRDQLQAAREAAREAEPLNRGGSGTEATARADSQDSSQAQARANSGGQTSQRDVQAQTDAGRDTARMGAGSGRDGQDTGVRAARQDRN